ncbi:group III truncated hemoglobin [Ekhidna sp.]|uniref:group III truncated hemoglobin n=1 Tax=Ekhidna sp. TaxID=2608089 RepID=UPI00329772DD
MKQIESRDDISLLVNTFYTNIRKDELLGPIFNHHIEEERWPVHLEMLTDFWEMNLFGTGNFNGKPGMKHIMVDRSLKNGITEEHFRQWVGLWFETLDTLFEGPLVEHAKNRAIQMANGQFKMVVRSRV